MEDTDGDGHLDKKVFAENLFFPTGYKWASWRLGRLAANPLFIPDRDGDDVPDGKPEVVLMAGVAGRHETLNSFTWGPDGWLYGCHGVFTHSNGKPGAPDSERQRSTLACGATIPPRKISKFGWGTSNPWG